jgi:transposase
MVKQVRKTFTTEFKLEAVRLLRIGGKDIAQLARELGVRRNQLYKWKAEIESHGDQAFPGSGRRAKEKSHAHDLETEVKRLREENEILKKAAAYFARELK